MQDPTTDSKQSTNQNPPKSQPSDTCLTLAQAVETSYETMYSHLPDDLKGRMIKAVDQMLDIGNNDIHRGQHLTNWALDAINLYKLIGISEEIIRQKVAKRLDDFLARGRRYNLSAGLNDGIEGIRLLTEGTRRLTTPNSEAEFEIEGSSEDSRSGFRFQSKFQLKYNLARFRQLVSHLGVSRAESISYYNTSLDDALTMALTIDDERRAFEICVHALRLGQFGVIYRLKGLSQNEQVLINIGMLALVDFYDQYFHYGIHNSLQNLEEAIVLFRSVQGDLKSDASEMLYDLAMEISSEAFIENYVRKSLRVDGSEDYDKRYFNMEHRLIVNALRALRATGTFVAEEKDILKTHLITRVEDKKVVDAIKSIVEKYGQHIVEADDFSDEVRMSLRAIGDVEKLNSLAELLFEHRNSHPLWFYHECIDYFVAAGNNEGVIKVIDAGLSELSKGPKEPWVISYNSTVVQLMARIGYVDGLKKIQEIAERKKSNRRLESYEREEWKKVFDLTEKALRGEPLEEAKKEAEESNEDEESVTSMPQSHLMPEYVRKAINDEKEYRKIIDDYRANLTPRKKEKLICEGYELLHRGDAWAAHNCFKEALYRRGLIEAGDKMLEKGNGLNAKIPYLFAALLPKEEELPVGERSVLSKLFTR